MASIVDSFREVFTDNLSFLKIIGLAIPVYYSYDLFAHAFFLVVLTVFLLFGFFVEVTKNVVSEGDRILPSLNPFTLAFSALKGIVAIGPTVLVCCFLANYLCSLINIIFWLDITLKILIWLVAASIIVTAYLMFSTKGNILDAYNLIVMYQKSGDVIVVLIFFLIQLTIINLPTTGFIGYTVLVLFGFGPIFNFYIAMAIVFNIAVAGHYLAQAHYENLTYNNPKANK